MDTVCVCLSKFSWCCSPQTESLLLPRVLSYVMNLSDICGIVVYGLLVLQSRREGSVLRQFQRLWCMELDVDIGMYLLRNEDNNWG